MGECTRIWAYRPVLVICFLSGQFSSKEKIHESLWTEIWKSTTDPLSWPSSCFPAKKGGSVTDNVVWRAFLNTVQLHPLWVKHYQPDREDNQALLVGLPVGEGDALVQSFVKDLWAVESIKFMQKILKVYLSWRSDQFCWINGKKESICQELHLQFILIPVLPSFQKDLCWQNRGLSGSTAYSYSLPPRRLRSVLGGLTTVGEDHNAFNGKEFKMAANYIFNLFEQNWKDP